METAIRNVPQNNITLLAWLCFCAGLVFCMIVIGAVTRLTESGLSMVEWKPLIGFIPPLSESEWQRVFDLYKQSPEYIKKNFWMEIGDFQRIFFWEWFHRLFGRLIGLAYALPLLWFWVRRLIPPGYKLPLLGLLFLGGAQGVMGWLMVMSGLVDQPAVSHYRLAAHLALAFLIFALMVWIALSLAGAQRRSDKNLHAHALAALAAFIFTMLWGAFTAGLDAGLIYNDSFPLMGGRWIPEEVTGNSAPLSALLVSPAGVQFVHRWLAVTTLLAILSLWLHAKMRHADFPALQALAVMIVLQAGLGIATLLSGVWLPLAALHQAGAVVICGLLVAVLYRLRNQK